ncbi:MAG: radical SAM protein [Deltaproteobacteria bacterium]|nr:radical SAM protein [Deltaproteobacteria bacterium]
MPADKVLIVSGGYVSVKDRSALHALRKQIAAFRASDAPWYDVHLKVLNAEHLLAVRRHRSSLAFRRSPGCDVVKKYFADERLFNPPELSDVILTTLMRAEGIETASATYSELFEDHDLRRRLLDECGCVFASATLLRDMSELVPMVAMLDRPDNHVVVGGALAGLVHKDWPGCPGVDVLAVGYGEMMARSLADWIRGGYGEIKPPYTGRVEHKKGVVFLYSGVPEDRGLDFLPTPDWSLAERVHGARFPFIHYESSRGCPYRCAFCSYPYLFDDRRYRIKSAKRIADEWTGYAASGVEYVSCLDSLFTLPRKRLVELCGRLIDAGSPIRWLCYARGDDLAENGFDDVDICRLMRRAGCIQVQMGIESGNQGILDNMDKHATVEAGAAAIENCRKAGIATFISVILGFPGETAETVMDTWNFISQTRPDFCYATPFTVRVPHLPVLNPESRRRFGILTHGSNRSSSPYWRHDTMSALEVGHWWRWIHRRMMTEGASLDASLFYKGMLNYSRAVHRQPLLDFQRQAVTRHPILRAVFAGARRWSEKRLAEDMKLAGLA